MSLGLSLTVVRLPGNKPHDRIPMSEQNDREQSHRMTVLPTNGHTWWER